jgi:hypothetical protein
MKRMITTVFLCMALGSPAQGYDYGSGGDAPHPNSKYWRATGQRPPLPPTSPKQPSLRLLQQENGLLRQQVQLLQQQIEVLRARLHASGREEGAELWRSSLTHCREEDTRP